MLLAGIAAERGFGVVIGRAADLPRYLTALPPATLLQMSAVFPEVFEFARRHHHVATALDEEGLIYRSRDDYLRRRIPRGVLEKLDLFFAWGAAHRSVLLSAAPDLAGRIVLAGNPRVDLLRPDIREIYRPDAKAICRRYGRFVLVNTNLGTYNHRMGADARIREWKERGWSSSEEGAELLRRTVDFQRRMFEEFAALIESLTAALPRDVSIILRPHPAEAHESWRARLGELNQVRVVHHGGVIPWLLAAEALIHNSCTTGIEALFLDRPAFAYTPARDELVEATLANTVSYTTDNRQALVDQIMAVIEDGIAASPERSAMEVLSGHIASLSGQLSSEVIVDHLQTVAPAASAMRNARGVQARVSVNRLAGRARSFASGVRRRDLAGERALEAFIRSASPRIALAEVETVLTRLAAATGRFQNVSCSLLAQDLVVVAQH